MYATPNNPDRCPVASYNAYKATKCKRPTNFSESHHPFYLATVTNTYTPGQGDQWFLRGPVGRNKLNNLMKQMATDANLPDLASKRITNISVRKHLC